MKRICIAAPPLNDFYFSPLRNSSLGLHTLRTIIEKNGYEVIFHDFPAAGNHKKTVKLPKKLNYLKKHLYQGERGGVSYFSQYYRFGPNPADSTRVVISAQPDVVLVGLFAFAYADSCIEFVNALKTASNCPVLVGGAGVSVNPSFFLENCSADYLFCGEADAEIISCIEYITGKHGRKPPGLIDCTEPSFTESRDYHPEAFPAVPYIHPAATGHTGPVKISVMLSRGCRNQCSFCANRFVFGRYFRKADPEILLDIVTEFRNRKLLLNFEDDNIADSPEFLVPIIDRISKITGGFEFMFENGLDYRQTDPSLLAFLLKSGLRQANFSLGSFESKSTSRHFSRSRLEQCVEMCKSSSIPVIVYFIAGLKSDTSDSVVSTIQYLSSIDVKIGFSPFYPVPGLAGFPVENFINPDEVCLTRGTSLFPWNESITTDEYVCFFRFIRVLNHCLENSLFPGAFFEGNSFISRNTNGTLPIPSPSPLLLEKLKDSVFPVFGNNSA